MQAPPSDAQDAQHYYDSEEKRLSKEYVSIPELLSGTRD